MSVSAGTATFGMSATATFDAAIRPNIANGNPMIGQSSAGMALTAGTIAFPGMLYLQDSGDTGTLNAATLGVTNDTEAAVAATGTVTFGTPVNGDTIVVNGTTLTKAASAGAAAFSTAAQLEVLIEALAGINSSETAGTITITAATAGEAGNAITLALGSSNTGTMAISGATLTGGLDATGWTGTANDFQGQAYAAPTAIQGLLVYCESGAVTVTQSTDLKLSLPATGKAQLAAAAGIASLLGSLVFTATANDTRVYISLMAK